MEIKYLHIKGTVANMPVDVTLAIDLEELLKGVIEAAPKVIPQAMLAAKGIEASIHQAIEALDTGELDDDPGPAKNKKRATKRKTNGTRARAH